MPTQFKWAPNYNLYEEDNTRSESVGITGPSMSVVLLSDDPWEDRFDIAFDLAYQPWPDLGIDLPALIAALGSGSGTGIIANIPVCTQVNISGRGAGSSIVPSSGTVEELKTYEQIAFTCTYEVQELNYEAGSLTEVATESLQPSVEFQKLDHRLFRWGSASGQPIKETETPGVQRPEMILTRSVKGASTVPADLINLMGHVNSAPYSSLQLGLTFAAETLLLLPPSLDRSISVSGLGIFATDGWNYSSSLAYNPNGWNRYWNSRNSAFEQLYVAGGSAYDSYPVSSFANILG